MIATGYSEEKAGQIAKLINEHNLLKKVYTAADINRSKAVYLPITVGNLVLASVAVERLNFLLSEIKHLTVLPALRKLGLGRKLVSLAIQQTGTPYILASIRANNKGSIALFESLDFHTISEVYNEGNKLRIVGREKVLPKIKPKVP